MMAPEERNERVMTLAEEALKRAVGERDTFLQSACQNDPDLYREVSDVVTWEVRMADFLSRPLIEFIDLETLEQVFEPGQIVAGRFEILRRVGDGGMGVVYEAFDTKRKQRIAIKFAKPGFRRLLSPELEGALKVRHPNVCAVNEIHSAKTEFGDLDFLTMEFLDGEPLSVQLAKGKLGEADALEIARQLCGGVAEAHRSGILHRDLKPGNVILCRKPDGSTRAVITDFGLCTQSASAGGVGGGTPGYMAPELLQDGKPSQASDVFSLGAILYEMVTGQRPFPASAEGKGTVAQPVPPSKLIKSLPSRWDKAVLPCLRSKPEQRCSVEQVIAALERKPFYQRPASVLAVVACLALSAFAVPRIVDALKPPPMRLAVLPIESPGDLGRRGQQILDDMAGRVKQIQSGKATASVIPLSKTRSKGVTTPQDAQKILGATHALQLRLHPEGDGIAVEATVVDLRTMAQVRSYSGSFAQADLTDLPVGLTGLTSFALHLRRRSQPETVEPAAAAAYKQGRAYLDADPHDFKAAVPQFWEALRLDPHSPLPPAGMVEAYAREFQSQKNAEAINEAQTWLARAEALNPDSPTVRMASGLLYTIRGNYVKALDDYKRVEEIEPGRVEAMLGAGLAYESQGLLDQAIAQYNLAISAHPNQYLPYEYLAALHFYHGQYDQAEKLYKQDIERAPARGDAYTSLAAVYTAETRYDEAEKVYKDLLQVKESPLTLNDIGAMLAFQGRQKEAMKYYQRAVTMAPRRAVSWLNLGDAQRRIKDLVRANDSYQRGMRLIVSHITQNIASPLNRAYLAYLQARLGLKEEARREITAALNSPGKDNQVLIMAVLTYEALHDRVRALAAAAMSTIQTRNEINHHPDLADLQNDSRFKLLIGQNQ